MAVYRLNAGTHHDRYGPNGARRHFGPKDQFNSPDDLLRHNYILKGEQAVPSTEKFTKVQDADDPALATFIGTAGGLPNSPPPRPKSQAEPKRASDYDSFPLEQMELADLRRMAEDNEIPLGKAKTKDEVVRAIRSAGSPAPAGGGGAA